MNFNTSQPKPETVQRRWFLVDATDKVLGRLASEIALVLRGKHRPYFTPYWDLGDHVVVINAKEVVLTGRKEEKKIYYRHSGYPGGLKEQSAGQLREQKPEELIRRAVKGMLPKNRLSRQVLCKLHIYPGPEHPHKAQKPQRLPTRKGRGDN